MIEVTFSAINSGKHGSPGTILKRIYENASQIAHLPIIGENIIIQFGEIVEQSSTFKVEQISKSFWGQRDVIDIIVRNVE
jgi:hypothetical protein